MPSRSPKRNKLSFTDDQILSYLGIGLGLAALIVSFDQADAGRKIPFQATLYETRVNAMKDYARAHYEYDNTLRAFLADIPYDVFSPEALAATKDFGMQHNAIVARRFRDAYAQYTANVNPIIGLWPNEIQTEIVTAGDAASTASECIIALGGKSLSEGTYSPEEAAAYWQQVRQIAGPACVNLNDRKKIIEFQNAGQAAMRLMRDQLQKTQTDLVPNG